MHNSELQFPKTAISDGTDILGTLANPLRVDPTGTTVQPVSIVSDSEIGVSLHGTGQASLDGTMSQIAPVNASRVAIVVTNTSSTDNIWVGNSGIDTTTGHFLGPFQSISMPITSAVFGITAGATIVATYLEIQ